MQCVAYGYYINDQKWALFNMSTWYFLVKVLLHSQILFFQQDIGNKEEKEVLWNICWADLKTNEGNNAAILQWSCSNVTWKRVFLNLIKQACLEFREGQFQHLLLFRTNKYFWNNFSFIWDGSLTSVFWETLQLSN